MSREIAEGSAQYRNRYAEPESDLATLFSDSFDVVLTVPVCGEAATFVDRYRRAARGAGRLLIVAVINGRVGADDKVHEANAECARALKSRFSLRELGRGGWLGHDGTMSLSLLMVDRFTPGRRLPARQGVGLARKIGADIALELLATERVRHPFVAMTDADTTLPDDYFERIAKLDPECAAAMFPFWHEPTGQRDIDRATALYEVRLRYLQRGLQSANSPYAFHSVGSTLAVHALSYAQARGVPKRQAAEDFYLLNKLCKLRPLARVQGAPLRIDSRVSDRVPFGTGAATATLSRGDGLELYHPQCFAAVSEVIVLLTRLSESPQESLPKLLAHTRPPVQDVLESQGALRDWPTLSDQAPSRTARLRHLHEWFDGFRTLKLMHHVRDHGAPSLPWREAIELAPFMDEVEDDGACLDQARTELLQQEVALPGLVGPSLH
jgi:hypothetical protein